MMRPEKTVRLKITGKVQGVGYRIWATRTAIALGLRGWVRNRSDGSVEALAAGAPDAVGALTEACRQGPYGAHVTAVAVIDAEDDGSRGFTALPTGE
jgi:acylphosphatase